MGRKARIISGFLALLIVVTGLMCGCAVDEEGTSSPTDVIKLKFSHAYTPTLFLNQAYQIFADLVDYRTNGRVQIEIYPAEQLGKALDHYDMVTTGVADIVAFGPGYAPGRFQLCGITTLPFAFIDANRGTLAFNELYKQGYLEEFNDTHVLTLMVGTPNALFFSNKKVTTLEELQGLKIRSTGGSTSKVLEALGAVPVVVPPIEVYTSLERGIVDGAWWATLMLEAGKAYEITDYLLDVKLPSFTHGIFMNKEKYESLPKDIQEIIDQSAEAMLGWKLQEYERLDAAARKSAASHGVEIYSLSNEETIRWQNIMQQAWEDWEQEMEGKGLPAKEVIEAWWLISEDFGVSRPF